MFPGLSGGGQGARLARPSRAHEHRNLFSTPAEPPDGVCLVATEARVRQRPVGGRDRDTGGASGFYDIEDGLLGFQGPPGAVTGRAGTVRAGQAHHVAMCQQPLRGRLDHLAGLLRAASVVRWEYD